MRLEQIYSNTYKGNETTISIIPNTEHIKNK